MLLIYLVIGIALIVWGADRLTDGAAALALRLSVTPFVVGLTVVAMGTSAPELCVSLVAAINGSGGLALGNVVGSNIANALLIVGITALVAPMTLKRTTVMRDMPVAVAAGVVLLLLCLDGGIARWEGVLLLVLFVAFLLQTLYQAKRARQANEQGGAEEDVDEAVKSMPLWLSIVWIVVGLACLIAGGQVFVNGAVGVAKLLGVSDALVGLTIVAVGTSLPELATSVVAARKGESAMAIGNVIGSNVFNVLLIVGATGVVSPFTTAGITGVDLVVSAAAVLLLWLFSYTKLQIERWEGFVLTAAFVAYIAWLIHAA